jgi:PAS domain S-box-containing protein
MLDAPVALPMMAAMSLAERQLQVMEAIARDELLHEVLALITAMVEAEAPCDARAAIAVLDSGGARVHSVTAPRLPAAFVDAVYRDAIPTARGSCGAAAAANAPVVTPDLRNCPSWEALAPLAGEHGLVAAWSHPIRGARGRVAGTLGTYFSVARSPTTAERQLVEIAVRAAAIAIERHRERERRDETERRARFFAQLGEITQPLTEPAELMRASAKALAEFLQVDRCAYAAVEHETVFVITGDFSRDGVDSIVGRWPVQAFGAACQTAMRGGHTYVVTDSEHDARLEESDRAAYRATRIAAVICVPLHKDGRVTAAMAVHQVEPRVWSRREIAIVEEVAARCWEALERVRVTQALKDSEARYRAMVEAHPECVKLVASDGTLLQMNAAGLRMIEAETRESVVGQCVYPLIAKDDRAAFAGLNQRVCAGERGEMAFEIIGLKGTRRRMETVAVPLALAGGGYAHLAVTRDVTARHSADRALADSRARLDYAVRLSGIGFWYCDLPFDELVWDERVKAHFWLDPDARVTIETFYARIHPDDRDRTREAIETSIATHAPYDVQYRTVDPATGAIKWIRALGGSAYAADGSPVRFDGVTVDVSAQTEREQVLQRLANRQAFQLKLADRIGLPLSPNDIIDAASELLGTELRGSRVVYVEVDDAAGTVQPRYGWTREGQLDLTGRTLVMEDFGPDLIRDLRAGRSVINRDVTRDRRTAANQDAFLALGVRSELVVPLLKDGRLAVVLAIHADTPRDWSDEDLQRVQDVAARTWLAVDVAQAQAALRAERDLSHSIFESMAEGFALLEPDGTIHYINGTGAQLLGAPAQALVGRAVRSLPAGGIGPELVAMHHAVCQARAPTTFDGPGPAGPGQPEWLEVRADPVPGGRVGVFIRDISARKHTEATALAENRRKDEFLAMLAHELRNPLAPIRAAADLLAMGSLDADRLARTSAIISRQVTHMTGLVDDLLDVSRVTRGLVELDRAPVELPDIVAAAIEQVRPMISARAHRLAVHLAPMAGRILGDEKRLVQVVTNLLTNAAKYTPDGGDIAVRAAEADGAFILTVSDNGIGMSPELLQRAFELFTQAERTSDRTQGGLGIGLALVRSLVQLHGGTVSAQSSGPGQGTEFTVRLPQMQGLSARTTVREGSPPHSLAGARVLVVDDNEDAAGTLAMCLETLGCICTVAHKPSAALDCIASDRPDVCIFDIGLPEMDGNELARRARAACADRPPLLIAVTGYGQEQDRRATLDAGFDHHMVKPPDLTALTRLIAGTRR